MLDSLSSYLTLSMFVSSYVSMDGVTSISQELS